MCRAVFRAHIDISIFRNPIYKVALTVYKCNQLRTAAGDNYVSDQYNILHHLYIATSVYTDIMISRHNDMVVIKLKQLTFVDLAKHYDQKTLHRLLR
jgi:hypothetical protein